MVQFSAGKTNYNFFFQNPFQLGKESVQVKMTQGWFDLFRDHGGPTLYPESNRTSVIADVQALTIYIVFATLMVAFFVVMPGIRKER